MAIEMVLADIDENANGGIERRSEIDLIRRDLDNMRATNARRFQREDGSSYIAAHLRLVTPTTQ